MSNSLVELPFSRRPFSAILCAYVVSVEFVYSLLTSRSIPLNVVVFLTRSGLLLKPLTRQVRVSSESPVVVIVDGKGVHVPTDEHQDEVDEPFVDHVGSSDSQQLHSSEDNIEPEAPGLRWLFGFHYFY